MIPLLIYHPCLIFFGSLFAPRLAAMVEKEEAENAAAEVAAAAAAAAAGAAAAAAAAAAAPLPREPIAAAPAAGWQDYGVMMKISSLTSSSRYVWRRLQPRVAAVLSPHLRRRWPRRSAAWMAAS